MTNKSFRQEIVSIFKNEIAPVISSYLSNLPNNTNNFSSSSDLMEEMNINSNTFNENKQNKQLNLLSQTQGSSLDENIQKTKHPLLSVNPELINVMDETEKLYAQKIEEENYLEASQIAKEIHEMYERVADALKMKQDSDEYANAIQWSSYWKIRQQTNERRIRSN